ncbi:hypothetical protein ACFFV7_42410 [Nonomuraea spiralis]|uniref:Adenylyl-sulfate kinase n=1 Tax=Nonomuraea spiralis TaxID=46182 RepID=A0ABV5IV87_9ACTN|nr:hypothetical protein [Nonomuraea spiralis]GGS92986.1 hypothetical protein GCM10010176_041080 [Nonomuraea spiralis]
MRTDRVPLLWLSGPTGVGKSSLGWEIFDRLGRGGVKAAFVDADQISLCHPEPEGGTHRVRARNLAALWPGFLREGMRCLVLAGFVDTPEEVREYTELLPGAAFTVCRLRVPSEELRERFLGRGWRPDLVEAAVAEAAAQEGSRYADLCVDTGGRTVAEAAQLVLGRLGAAFGTAAPAPGRVPVVQGGGVAAAGRARVPLLWFSGATASGKSTVGYEVFSRIHRSGVRAAYVDLRQIAALRPSSADEGRRLKARGLAALWAGYRADGAAYLVVSGEADSDETVRAYARLLPDLAPTVFRLHASPATLLERVLLRGRGGGPATPGDELRGLGRDALRTVAARAAREAAALDRAGAGDLRVDTDDRPPPELAAQVLSHLGLPTGT